MLSYGIMAALVKIIQFGLIQYLEKELSPASFSDFGIKYSIQMGVFVFGVAGINEGIVNRYVLGSDKAIILEKALWLALRIQLILLLLGLSMLAALGKFNYISPFVNGIILANCIVHSSLSKLKEDHKSSMFFAYAPLFVFQVVYFAALTMGLDGLEFISTSIALGFFFIVSNIRDIFKIKALTFSSFDFSVIETSFPFFIVAIIGWISGLGLTLVISNIYGNLEAGMYFYLYSFVGAILLFTTAIFDVWNAFYLNSSNLSHIFQDKFYNLLSVLLSLVVGLLLAGLFVIKKLPPENLIKALLIFANFIFYVPIWRFRLYLTQAGRGGEMLRITVISLLIAAFTAVLIERLLLGYGVYVFFLLRSVVMVYLGLRMFSGLNYWVFVYAVGIYTLVILSLWIYTSNHLYAVLFFGINIIMVIRNLKELLQRWY